MPMILLMVENQFGFPLFLFSFGNTFQKLLNVFNGVHGAFGHIGSRYALLQKPLENRRHTFAYFNDMKIGIIKAHHMLSSGVFFRIV